MTEPTAGTSSQRADLEKAVRTYGGHWDTNRGLRALRDAGHDPQEKNTRHILRDLARQGLLVKVEDWPVRYRATQSDADDRS
ncbi:hypothetical protein [Streptomyces hirsutus]|uniref:hypothetical protein n=1 Tax=Streptomyces hirsutus TaxID=35620 RepID=UPI000A7664FD|nr:hypothetical protein [Streptomyces hirsutus]